MSDCNVCLTYDGDVNTEFIHQRIVVARKEYRCCECGAAIRIADKYERSSGKSDGDLWAYKTCLPCAEIGNAFFCEGRWFGGILWDEMQEQAFPTMNIECLKKLGTAAAKEFLIQKWNEWKFDHV
jgi:hypothetical protein